MNMKLTLAVVCPMLIHAASATSENNMHGIQNNDWNPTRRRLGRTNAPKRNRQVVENADEFSFPGNNYGHHSMMYHAKSSKGYPPHGERLLEEDEFSISIHSGKSFKSTESSEDSLDSNDERRLRRGGRRTKKKPLFSFPWNAKSWKPGNNGNGSSDDLYSTSSSEDFSFSFSMPSTPVPTPDPSLMPSIAPSMAPTQESMQLCNVYLSYVDEAEVNHTTSNITSWWSACGDVDPSPFNTDVCPSGLVVDNICQSVDFDVPIQSEFCEPLFLSLSNDTDLHESCVDGCMKYVSLVNGGDCCYLDCGLSP